MGADTEKDTEKQTEKQRQAEPVKRNWAEKSLGINPWRGKRQCSETAQIDESLYVCVYVCTKSPEPAVLLLQNPVVCDSRETTTQYQSCYRSEREEEESEEQGPVNEKNASLQFT